MNRESRIVSQESRIENRVSRIANCISRIEDQGSGFNTKFCPLWFSMHAAISRRDWVWLHETSVYATILVVWLAILSHVRV